MSIAWSDAEKALLEDVRATMSTREIVKVFTELGYKRSADAIQKQSKKLGISFKDYGKPAPYGLSKEEATVVEKTVQERENTLSTVTIQNVLTPGQKSVITRQQRTEVAELIADLQAIREITPRFGSAKTHVAETDKESLVVVLSDWHVGRIVTNTEANEVMFNIAAATQRILSTPDLVMSMFTSEELGNFDELVLLFIGDIVDGEGVYPHQELSLQTHAVEQIKQATKATWEMIQTFRAYFPYIRIVTTRGNHGRTGSSPEANWDNVVYQMLEILVDMDGGDNISIKNRYGDYATIDIRGWKGLLRHRAPVQADTAAGRAKFAGWHGIHEWDFFCFGHYHHWGVLTWNGKPIYRNGSLVGGDEYAESLSVYDQAAQLCFGVREDKVCTFVKPIIYPGE
jgi:hypothetical protein